MSPPENEPRTNEDSEPEIPCRECLSHISHWRSSPGDEEEPECNDGTRPGVCARCEDFGLACYRYQRVPRAVVLAYAQLRREQSKGSGVSSYNAKLEACRFKLANTLRDFDNARTKNPLLLPQSPPNLQERIERAVDARVDERFKKLEGAPPTERLVKLIESRINAHGKSTKGQTDEQIDNIIEDRINEQLSEMEQSLDARVDAKVDERLREYEEAMNTRVDERLTEFKKSVVALLGERSERPHGDSLEDQLKGFSQAMLEMGSLPIVKSRTDSERIRAGFEAGAREVMALLHKSSGGPPSSESSGQRLMRESLDSIMSFTI